MYPVFLVLIGDMDEIWIFFVIYIILQMNKSIQAAHQKRIKLSKLKLYLIDSLFCTR